MEEVLTIMLYRILQEMMVPINITPYNIKISNEEYICNNTTEK